MININGYSNSSLKIGGLASGFDTDDLVSKLMSAEKHKAYKLDAQKQTYVWQQEEYRKIIDQMNGFKSKYFDILNKKTNMLTFGASKKVITDSTKSVEIIASNEAKNKTYVINKITSLATASSVTGDKKLVGQITGNLDLDSAALDFAGHGFKVTLDGVTRDITVMNNYENRRDFLTDLQGLLDDQFGEGRIKVDTEDKFLKLSADNSRLTVNSSEGLDLLSRVGVKASAQNVADLQASLDQNFGPSTGFRFSINGTEFFFTGETKLSTVIQTVNSSSAGVIMEYSGVTDKISVTSKQTGASSNVTIQNIYGNFFGETGITGIKEGVHKNGTDAVIYLNDDTDNPVIRSTNTFTADGITFSLKATSQEPVTFTVENDTAGMFDLITEFVNDFNKMIETLEEKLGEKVYNEYKPLNNEQKESMSEKEIELWEEKAKSGILRNDSLLSSLKDKLRSSFSTPVQGLSLSFYDIGIKTSRDVSSFRIEIDEFKLKDAISKDPDQVAALFSKTGEISYSVDLTSEQRTQRTTQIGFAQKVSDIFADYIRTGRDKNNHKGLLIEKAGIKGDTSVYNNAVYKRIEAVEKSIIKTAAWLKGREEFYWRQFSAMEAALSKLYSQSDWLAAQFASK